jgi:hypothetical protein
MHEDGKTGTGKIWKINWRRKLIRGKRVATRRMDYAG